MKGAAYSHIKPQYIINIQQSLPIPERSVRNIRARKLFKLISINMGTNFSIPFLHPIFKEFSFSESYISRDCLSASYISGDCLFCILYIRRLSFLLFIFQQIIFSAFFYIRRLSFLLFIFQKIIFSASHISEDYLFCISYFRRLPILHLIFQNILFSASHISEDSLFYISYFRRLSFLYLIFQEIVFSATHISGVFLKGV